MAKDLDFISHWSQLFENFQASSLEFYDSVEKAVESRAVPETHWKRVEHKEAGLASAKRLYLRMHRGRFAFDICAAPFGNGFFVSWWLYEPPLEFGWVFTLAFFACATILMGILGLIGFAIGSSLFGLNYGTIFAAAFGWLATPLLLWILGNMVRQGTIPGESTFLAMPIVGWIYAKIFTPPTFYAIDTALMFQSAVGSAVNEVIDCMTASKGIRALTEEERKPVMKKFTASV